MIKLLQIFESYFINVFAINSTVDTNNLVAKKQIYVSK